MLGKRVSGKRKKVVLSLPQKVEICERLDMGESRNVLMKEFNVGYSTICGIKAQQEQLVTFISSMKSRRHVRQRSTIRKAKLEQLEEALFEWYTLKRSENSPVSGPMIIEKAKNFYKEMGIKDPCAFSNGWLRRFKRRYGVEREVVDRNKVLVDSESAEAYRLFFSTLVAEHDLSPEQVYNASETEVFWRCLNDTTKIGGGESNGVHLKRIEDQLTVYACCNASGTHKVELMVVGESDQLRSLRDETHLPIVYKEKCNGVLDKEVYIDWFKSTFVPSVKKHFRNIGKSENSCALLLLGNCAKNLDCELVCGNIFTSFLPSSVTSSILPMNLGIIQDFTCNYRIDVMTKLINHKITVEEFMISYSIKDVVLNLANAWKLVGCDVVKKSWKTLWPDIKCGESSCVDFVECNSSLRKMDLPTLVDNPSRADVIGELQRDNKDAVEDNWDPDSLVCADAIDAENLECGGSMEVDESEESTCSERDSNKEVTTEEQYIAWDDAASGIETFMKFAEQQSCCTADEVNHIRCIYKKLIQRFGNS